MPGPARRKRRPYANPVALARRRRSWEREPPPFAKRVCSNSRETVGAIPFQPSPNGDR